MLAQTDLAEAEILEAQEAMKEATVIPKEMGEANHPCQPISISNDYPVALGEEQLLYYGWTGAREDWTSEEGLGGFKVVEISEGGDFLPRGKVYNVDPDKDAKARQPPYNSGTMHSKQPEPGLYYGGLPALSPEEAAKYRPPLGIRSPWFQPEGSNYCGAACLSSVVGIRLEVSHKAIGKKGLTSAKQMREAFAKFSLVMGPRQHPKHQDEGKLYLARIHWPDSKKTHWVVLHKEGGIFDPASGYDPEWPEGTRITSIYELTPRPLPR